MTNSGGVKWEQVALGDVVEPLTTTDPRKQPEESFEYIDVSSVSRITHSIHATSPTLGCDAPSRARRLVRAGDVLFATIRPTLQRIAIVPAHLDQAICSTGYFVLRPKSNINGRFLFYCLFSQSFSDEMALLQRGANYPAVSDRDVREHLIHIPPLAEQKQIVAVLDESFTAIATATANTKKNIANAQELFDSELNRVLQPPQPADNSVSDVTAEWRETTLGEVCELYQPKTISKKEMISDGKYLVFGANGVIGRHNKFNHEEPQLLITCRGATCGSVNISEPQSWITGNAMVVRPKVTGLSLRFLEYLFRGSVDLTSVISGAAQPQITRKSLLPVPIFYPPSLSEQKRIATFLGKLSAEKQTLVKTYETKIHSLTELKQSLLHQAFTGELTSK